MLIPVLPVLRVLGLSLWLATLLALELSFFSSLAPFLLVLRVVELLASATSQFIPHAGLLYGVLHGVPNVSEEG